MKTIVGKDIRVSQYNKALLEYCEMNLVVSNKDYYVAQRMGRYLGNIQEYIYLYEKRGDTLVLPFGALKHIWNIIKDTDVTLDFAAESNLNMQGDIKLYDYQESALKTLVKEKSGILEAPCGSGKTQIGIALIQALGQKALWLTHTGDLLNQSMDRAKQYYDGDFGTITAGKVNIGQDITFATVQTMVKLNLSQYAKEWNVIIVDECHRVAGSPTKVMQFYKVLSNLNARHKYGLSATLHRADEMIKSTYAMLGNVVYAITDKDVSQKVIKSRHMKIETHVPWSEAYLETDGTMNYAGLIEYLTKSKERNYLIANHLVHHKHEFNLVLSARVNHLVELKNICESFGLEAELVIGSINNQKRSEIFERVRQGHLHIILSTYALAKEGLDIPNLNRLHLATPQKNKSVTKQAAGRVERRIHDKHDAMILDYVDEHISYCETMYKKRKSILK